MSEQKPFAYFGKYANGEEAFVRTLPTNPEYEDMLSGVVRLYTHPPSERVRELVDSLAKLADSWAFHSDPNVAKCRRELVARLSAIAAEGLKEGQG